jgi:hypothetical protein
MSNNKFDNFCEVFCNSKHLQSETRKYADGASNIKISFNVKRIDDSFLRFLFNHLSGNLSIYNIEIFHTPHENVKKATSGTSLYKHEKRNSLIPLIWCR